MLSWASILYGAALSAVVASVALTALTRPRQPAVILTGALATTAVLLGVGSLAAALAWRTIGLAVLCGLAAFLVDVYLY
jgi:hypothetical protein